MSSYLPTTKYREKDRHCHHDDNDSHDENNHSIQPKKFKMASNTKRPTTRAPKTRTKSGCFTCRKRKKKCDEAYPVCSGCSRNFLKCSWPKFATETLPKHFEIDSSANTQLDIGASCDSNANMELDSTGEAKASFTVVGKDLLQQIEVDENEEMHEEYDIPAKMCSIIKVSSYHHEGDTSPMYSSSSDYDFIINFGSQKGSPPLSIPESDVQPSYQSIESQSVNQMFSSLYDTLSTWSELDEKLFTTMDYKFNHQLSPLPTKTDDGSWLPLARNLLSITGMKFHNERSVVSTLLATFPMLIYFTTDISNIPTPFSYYEENHSLFSTILSDQFESSTNTLITTLKQTIYENFAKLIYSIRVPQQSTTLESIKSAMTITYTHLQTIEIQQSHQSKTTSLLKLVHYVSEILVLKLDDSSITNENSTVQHYLEMFVDEYRSTLEESDSTGSSLLNSPITNGMVCSPVTEVSDEELDDRRYIIGMLLLIAGCVSKSMEHREFIAKEMYIMKRQSDNEWFEFSLLGLKLEDLWCREERNEVSALDCLFDRVGFDDCLV